MTDLAERIARRAEKAGVGVQFELATALASYVGLLAKWNATINLTALQLEPPTDDAVDRLVVEPLVAAGLVLPSARLAIDIGSGGGSPALPMKLALPAVRFVLVESRTRKAAFLREAVRELGLTGAEVANSRFDELLTHARLIKAADLVTLRAVKVDTDIWKSIRAALKPGGKVMLFTGAEPSISDTIPPPFRIETTETVSTSRTRVMVVGLT